MHRIISVEEATFDQVRNWLIKHVGRISSGDGTVGTGWKITRSRTGLLIVALTDDTYVEDFKTWVDSLTPE